MFHVHGKKPFGTCDVVPELFYVATLFFHIDYVPLIPLGSHLILGKSGNTYKTVKIPFSFKSLFYAWGRTAAFGGLIVVGVMALIGINDQQMQQNGDLIRAIVVALAFGLVFAFLMLYPRRIKPSYPRACQLAQLARLDDRGWAALNVIYGREIDDRPADMQILPASTPPLSPLPPHTRNVDESFTPSDL